MDAAIGIDVTAIDRRGLLDSRLAQYARMVEIRKVEECIQRLYNEGHLRGSTHLCNGQEAVVVGIAAQLRASDVVTCTYRGHGMALALGVPPTEVLAEITGRTIGCAGGLGGSMHLFGKEVGLMPTFAIVGAGLPVAVGAALTESIRNTDGVALAVFGDGSTNIGAFHESMNLASLWKLPVVFVCENNLYGEYTRIDLSTPITELAERAASYAMPARQVDGQDLDAVLNAVAEAVAMARRGGGPMFLEMKTYRYSGHSRSDKATYRPSGELEEWLARDPITLFGRQLVKSGDATEEGLAKLAERVAERVDAAADEALAAPAPDLAEMFKHVHA